VSTDIVLRELEKDTLDDRETVNIVLKRYALPLKLLFKRYSGTGYSHSKNIRESFETLQQRSNMMIEAEFYKLLKEHGVTPGMLSKDEFHQLMKLYN
jgi:hypothetical protein